VRVSDDGVGMSPADARMAFERHATSKIRTLDDLFNLRTFGFRGEALASIAAVAQVRLLTRPHDAEIGTLVEISGGKYEKQEPAPASAGTVVAVRNLFFNVPARRNFLKSNPVELRHVVQEFFNFALAYPSMKLKLVSNGETMYDLPAQSPAQRVAALFDFLPPDAFLYAAEETPLATVAGFALKPELCKKSLSGKYLYANGRFIRSPLLHHAVASAYEGLLPSDVSPFYVLFLSLDPKHVDINIHPTKTEVKFDDERTVYSVVQAAVRRALGEVRATNPVAEPQDEIAKMFYRNGESGDKEMTLGKFVGKERGRRASWREVVETLLASPTRERGTLPHETPPLVIPLSAPKVSPSAAFSLTAERLVAALPEGLLVVDRRAAVERIAYEQFLSASRPAHVQRLLYPHAVQFSPEACIALKEHLDDLRKLGFDLEVVNETTLLVCGAPADLAPSDVRTAIQELAEEIREAGAPRDLLRDWTARLVAVREARRAAEPLPPEQALELVKQLFACENARYSPSGKPIFRLYEHDFFQI
ncbi:MAG: DNA mismatch repair endonuclease MutL, partial [Bacteroidia bacterium]|nr:DNA mismatch repair endonuclease MutL [Bacteroidia bacterium]